MSRRLNLQEPAEEDALNITAMVDVVFILLAFFVLTTRFVGLEQDLAVAMEETADGVGATAEDLPSRVVIELRPAGADAVAIRFGQVDLEPGAFEAITARLEAMAIPTLPVTIAADPTLSVDVVTRAIDAVLASPNQQVGLVPLGSVAGAGRGAS